MFRRVLLLLGAIVSTTPFAHAEFEGWSAEVEDDPFSKSQNVTASYMSSIRSGVFIVCNGTGDGVQVRIVPGYAYVPEIASETPNVQFAIDGEILASGLGKTASVGDSLAAIDVSLLGSQSRNFVRSFAIARKQIAIQDGLSDKPHFLRARGSTKSGEALLKCMRQQKSWVDG